MPVSPFLLERVKFFARTLLTGALALLPVLHVQADQATQIVPGTTITLSVTVSGTAPFSFQWKRNGSNIGGATGPSYSMPNVSNANIGEYSVEISNSAGSTLSDYAVVTAAQIVYPPAIISHPASQTVFPGGIAVMSVSANGSTPLSYQWRKDGVDLPGETEDKLYLDSITSQDFGAYTVVVSNSAGSVTSEPATITDATIPPSFSTSLSSQTALVGETVKFSAEANGTAPFTYQWRKDGINLSNGANVSGATTPTLTLSNLSAGSAGVYSLTVSNSAGANTTNGATLTVTQPPVSNQGPEFILHPISKTVAYGETVTLIGEIKALPTATYRWRKNGEDLIDVGGVTGSRTSVLTIYGANFAHMGTYTLVATNGLGSATSNAAELIVTLNKAPYFTTQPVSQAASAGQLSFFTAAAEGHPRPTYQWRRNGTDLRNGGNITGATSNTLVISNVSTTDLQTYTVVATNSVGSTTSQEVTLGGNGAPVITTQAPALTVASTGSVVTLSVQVGGSPTPTVQWKKGGTNLSNGGNVSGVTSTTLTLSGVTSADAGVYSVQATNSQGSVQSNNYEVSVLGANVVNQTVTSGKDVTLASPSATGSLRWQVSNAQGANWTDLSDNGTYSGTSTNALKIAAPASSLNGNLYRLVNTAGGTTTVVYSARLNVANAFLPFPVALATDTAGNLFVADASNDTIHKIDGASQISVLAGTAGQVGTVDGTGAAARFNDPSGVSVSFDNVVTVADKANATIRQITSGGVVTTLAGSTSLRGNNDGAGTASTFSAPIGVTRDTAGNLYIADSMNHTIRKITTAGTVSTLAGAAGQPGFADGSGTSARFNNPSGIDVDLIGNVYVADTTNNVIRKITPSGNVTTLAGLNGVSGTSDGAGNAALFNQPVGLAVDNAANVYVADTGNSTIRHISPAGQVSTLAGLPGIAGHKDGGGLDAWFNQPRDVALTSAGVLYVADTGNAAIRKIDATGIVTTLPLVAGTITNPNPTVPLPPTPSLPDPVQPPSVPTSPNPGTGGGGGGGGGAPSLWFCAAAGALYLLRLTQKRKF